MAGDLVWLAIDHGSARVEVGAHRVGLGDGDSLTLTPETDWAKSECDYTVVFGNG